MWPSVYDKWSCDLVCMISDHGVSVKAGLWTVDWTMDWTMDWVATIISSSPILFTLHHWSLAGDFTGKPSLVNQTTFFFYIRAANKATELHLTLFSCPNIKEKNGLVHETQYGKPAATRLAIWHYVTRQFKLRAPDKTSATKSKQTIVTGWLNQSTELHCCHS